MQVTTIVRIACAAAITAFIVGCGDAKKKEPVKAGNGDKSAQQQPKADPHDHPTEGPHHGHLIELGNEEYHAELTHDDAAKKVTVYLLNSKAKDSVTTTAADVTINLTVEGKPRQFKLAAAPQDGDKPGESSRFELVDEQLLEALDDEKTTGRLNVQVGGTPYVGQIEHHAHDEHEEHEKK